MVCNIIVTVTQQMSSHALFTPSSFEKYNYSSSDNMNSLIFPRMGLRAHLGIDYHSPTLMDKVTK